MGLRYDDDDDGGGGRYPRKRRGWRCRCFESDCGCDDDKEGSFGADLKIRSNQDGHHKGKLFPLQ